MAALSLSDEMKVPNWVHDLNKCKQGQAGGLRVNGQRGETPVTGTCGKYLLNWPVTNLDTRGQLLHIFSL